MFLLDFLPDLTGETRRSSRGNEFRPDAPSFQDKVTLEPADLISYGKVVRTGSFRDHVLGIGRKRSSLPGADYDAAGVMTEGMARGWSPSGRPVVTTAAAGKVVGVKQEPWGRLSVIDRNGWTHVYIHNSIESPAPESARYFGFGENVDAHLEYGYLFNAGTKKDHVHYSVISPDGKFYDPENLLRSRVDGAIEGIINPEHETNILRERDVLDFIESHDNPWNILDTA